jgi:hypothetical protein
MQRRGMSDIPFGGSGCVMTLGGSRRLDLNGFDEVIVPGRS